MSIAASLVRRLSRVCGSKLLGFGGDRLRNSYSSGRNTRTHSLRLEPLEERQLLSAAPYPEIPGMVLVDPVEGQFEGQVVYLDFDGAQNVTYDGPVVVEGLDIPAFEAPGALAGQEAAIIDAVLAELQETFEGTGIKFTVEQPAEGTEYSTIYIGGDDSAFEEYGSFLGLAEKVDVGNADRGDEGFVFGEELRDPVELSGCVLHETAHLLGYAHSCETHATSEGTDETVAAIHDVASAYADVESCSPATSGYIELNDSDYTIYYSSSNMKFGFEESGSDDIYYRAFSWVDLSSVPENAAISVILDDVGHSKIANPRNHTPTVYMEYSGLDYSIWSSYSGANKYSALSGADIYTTTALPYQLDIGLYELSAATWDTVKYESGSDERLLTSWRISPAKPSGCVYLLDDDYLAKGVPGEFEVYYALAPPTNTPQINGNKATLSWSDIYDTTTLENHFDYLVQYSRDSNFGSGVTTVQTEETSCTTGALTSGETYYWRVAAASYNWNTGSNVEDCDVNTASSWRNGSSFTYTADDSYEENDSRSSSNPSISEDSWITAKQFDDDWYKISVPSDELALTIDCDFVDSEGDIDIALVDSSGNELEDSTTGTDDERIQYTVSSGGTYYIQVYYGDQGNTYRLRWSAEAVPEPEITVTCIERGHEVFDNDQTPSDWNGTDLGTLSKGETDTEKTQRTFRISNTGDASLSVNAFSVPEGYTIVRTPTSPIAADSHSDLIIEIDTSSVGTKGGELSFSTNDGNENPFNFDITGTVEDSTYPEIEVQYGSVIIQDNDTTPDEQDGTDFGNVLLNEPMVTRTYRVYNKGTGTLTLGSVSVPDGFFLSEPLSTTIGPESHDDFTIQIDTASTGTKSGTISFSNNDSNENPFNFDVTGTVVDLPGLSIEDESIVEGDSGQKLMSLTVRTSKRVGYDLWFRYKTVDNGTATAGADYTAVDWLHERILADHYYVTVLVPVLGDLLPEVDETFTVTIDEPTETQSRVVITDADATATIRDNERNLITDPQEFEQTYGPFSETWNGFGVNHRGRNEKYFTGANDVWYAILPSGDVYRQPLAGEQWFASGTMVASLDSMYWQDPNKLIYVNGPDRAAAYTFAHGRSLTEDRWPGWGINNRGYNEKYFYSETDSAWYAILPNGEIHHNIGGWRFNSSTLQTITSDYFWQDPNRLLLIDLPNEFKLYEHTNGQAMTYPVSGYSYNRLGRQEKYYRDRSNRVFFIEPSGNVYLLSNLSFCYAELMSDVYNDMSLLRRYP